MHASGHECHVTSRLATDAILASCSYTTHILQLSATDRLPQLSSVATVFLSFFFPVFITTTLPRSHHIMCGGGARRRHQQPANGLD